MLFQIWVDGLSFEDLEEEQNTTDTCSLARWNREIPFAELPNMVLEFLTSDTISGNSTANKSL